MTDPKIAAAEARSRLARKELSDALHALKDRLAPRTLARMLGRGIADKSSDAAVSATEAVKARPALAVGVAALAATFFARKPISRAISSAWEETPPEPTRSADEPS